MNCINCGAGMGPNENAWNTPEGYRCEVCGPGDQEATPLLSLRSRDVLQNAYRSGKLGDLGQDWYMDENPQRVVFETEQKPLPRPGMFDSAVEVARFLFWPAFIILLILAFMYVPN